MQRAKRARLEKGEDDREVDDEEAHELHRDEDEVGGRARGWGIAGDTVVAGQGKGGGLPHAGCCCSVQASRPFHFQLYCCCRRQWCSS